MNDTETVLPVVDVSSFSVGQRAIIYNALPAGAFQNLEHVLITAVDAATSTLSVQRGIDSVASLHDAGSIIGLDKLLINYGANNPDTILAQPKTLIAGQEIAELPVLHVDIASSLLPSSTHYGVADRVIDPVAYGEVIKDIRRHYWASISMIDDEIGRLVDYINNDPELSKNTIIVLWSDHGYFIGEYGDWAKQTNDELVTHIPLIVSTPGSRQLERTIDSGGSNNRKSGRSQLIELVDLYPSLVELAGLSMPLDQNNNEFLEGQSFVPLLQEGGESVPWKQYVFSQFEVRASLNDRNKQVRGTSVRSDHSMMPGTQ